MIDIGREMFFMKKYLSKKREITCSLRELTETAAKIFENNPNYDLIENNCQNFCNNFLKRYGLPTYVTDVELVKAIGTLYFSEAIPVIKAIQLISPKIMSWSSRSSRSSPRKKQKLADSVKVVKDTD